MKSFADIAHYLTEQFISLNKTINEDIDWNQKKTEFFSSYDRFLIAYNEICNIASSRGGKCISASYTNHKDYMTFTCSNEEHGPFEKSATDIKRGVWCNKCAYNASLDESISAGQSREMNNLTLDERVSIVRTKLASFIENGLIYDNMNTQELDDIIDKLDPSGLGRSGARDKCNRDLNTQAKCCRFISFFGDSGERQIIICLKTYLVFTRSWDNFKLQDRNYCPFCIVRNKVYSYAMTDPWAYIPVYTYTGARKTKINPEPLKFIKAFKNVEECVLNGKTDLPKNVICVMEPLRYSLCQCATGNFAKTNIPKRAACRKEYVSFYPPVNGYMDETKPNWILKRRLESAFFKHMFEEIKQKYVTDRNVDNAKYANKQ